MVRGDFYYKIEAFESSILSFNGTFKWPIIGFIEKFKGEN